MRTNDIDSFLATGQRLTRAILNLAQDNPPLIVAIVAGLALWVGAASLAASKAERGGYPPFRYWLVSLVLPLGYPLWVLFSLKPLPPPAPATNENEERRRLQLPASNSVPTPPSPNRPVVNEKTPPEPAAPSIWNQPFFQELMERQVITPVSPCFVTLRGTELAVTEILEALAQVVIVQVSQGKGAPQRMRIPYSGIQHLQLPCG